MADRLVVDSSVLVAAHVVEHPHRMLAAPRTGRAQQLAGNVHDALIVRTAEAHDLGLVTIDQGMHVLANGIVDVELLRLEES